MNLKILSLLAGGLVTAGGATTAVVISKNSSDTPAGSNETAEETLRTPKGGKSQPQSEGNLGSTNGVGDGTSSSAGQEDSSLTGEDQQLQDSPQQTTTPQSDVSGSGTH